MLATVVDYGMGNLRSLAKALEAVGADVCVSRHAADIVRADHIVLPGVGAFGACIESLRRSGLVEVIENEVRVKRKPFLGICLGMQILATEGTEYGVHRGLNWIPGRVRRLNDDRAVKVPHVGWNEVLCAGDTTLFTALRERATFYFVHSYHFVPESSRHIAAECEYGGPVVAAVQQENIFATQFHPEKSQDNGLRLLRNFLRWKP